MTDLVNLLRKVDEESMYAAPFTTKTLIDAAANRIEELMKYQSLHAGCDKASLDIEQKLVNQLAAAHKRIEELEKKVAELEARPQPTYAFGGAGNYWPWGTMSGLSQTTGAIGTNVSHETPKGVNGPAETSVKAS